MKRLLILTLLFLCGCDEYRPVTHVAYGTVRNLWCHAYCDVVFEHDNGEVSTLTFSDAPPMWAGEHVQLTYHNDMRGLSVVDSTRRLP